MYATRAGREEGGVHMVLLRCLLFRGGQGRGRGAYGTTEVLVVQGQTGKREGCIWCY